MINPSFGFSFQLRKSASSPMCSSASGNSFRNSSTTGFDPFDLDKSDDASCASIDEKVESCAKRVNVKDLSWEVSSDRKRNSISTDKVERTLNINRGTTHQVCQRDEHELAARPDVQVIRLEQERGVWTGRDRQLEVRVLGKVLSKVEAVRGE